MTEEKTVGRPRLYETLVLPRMEEVKLWTKAGATQKEIAAALGIGASTFAKYVTEEEGLAEVIEEAKMSGVPEVKLALFKRACGYEYEEKKVSMRRDEDGVTREYVEKTTKQVAPDTSAIAMYLRNCGDDWRDKDSLTYEFKERELELKKMLAEMNNF